jgi:hypothetical protein
MPLKENQEVKPTSRSHLAALVKRGQAAARDAGSQPKDKPSRTAELLLGKKKSRPSAAAEREMIQANRAGSNYDPTDVSDSYDAAAAFTNRVMNRVTEAFAEMTPGELTHYDNEALKPKNVRPSSESERKKYAGEFRANKRGEGLGSLGVKGQKRNDLKRRLGGKNPEADVARWIKNADGSGQWSDGYRGLDKPV